MLNKNYQQGIMLLEALIAMLIFSMGILAIVGLQASAIKVSGDAKYRSDASLLANELIGQMWVSNRDPNILKSNFEGTALASDGNEDTPYKIWASEVNNALPGVSENPPEVNVIVDSGVATSAGSITSSSVVSIKVKWKSPNETEVHKYEVVLQIVNA